MQRSTDDPEMGTMTISYRFSSAKLVLLLLAAGAALGLIAPAAQAQAPTHQLLLSLSPDRSGAVPLQGESVHDSVYVFTQSSVAVNRVRFYLDDPQMTGTPRQTESRGPYDFAGTATDGSAKPWNTRKHADGTHTITAAIEQTAGGTVVVSATFTIKQLPLLAFTDASVTLNAKESGTPDSHTTTLSASDGSAAAFSVSDDAGWLTVSQGSATTPAQVTLLADPAGLAPGTYNATVTASAPGYASTKLPVTFTVTSGAWCSNISPLACSDVMQRAPYRLDFGSDAGMIVDKNGVGTGFTMIDPPAQGPGLLPEKLTVDSSTGALKIATTAGLASGAGGTQDNALGVGIDAPDQVSILTTTLTNIPAGTGKYEQAGLWFGNDQDNYAKLVVRSGPTGTTIQYLYEVGGAQKNSLVSSVLDLSGKSLTLSLRADPSTKGVTGTYSIDGGAAVRIGILRVPPEFFSFDQARIDPTIGTDSFGGILASHRNATSPVTYTFDEFSLTAETSGGGSGGGTSSAFAFDRTSFNLNRPTAMAFGPDGRLYVTEFLGAVHALTLGPDHQPVADQVITAIGSRLTLGIAVDPASTPSNVILWVTHSDRNLTNEAPANSGIVSRLSGPGFTQRQDVITGLPRSKANHATNALKFGPDGRLYIAQSGNTGAGAPNLTATEFGDRPEQPLSAAILVADVKATGFQGSCATPIGQFGIPATCDVRTYATGFRNSYDFTFHRNGSLYATENGLGVEGSFPPSPAPPCTGLASTDPWNAGGQNPGEQPDLLMRVQQGKYYGHPNPYRDECVFKDGHYQGVSAMPTYAPPLLNLGSKKSSNGIIEYQGDAFGGALDGNLLIANYSQGDDIVRVALTADGTGVTKFESIASGFSDPLPLVEGPDGTVYVGEFSGGRITALVPRPSGAWTTKAPLPVAILDAGGAAVNGKFYFVAGKTASGPRKTVYVYDPATNVWTTGPSLPAAFPAVENPAVVGLNGKLYVFGGSTDAFSGASAAAAVLDTGTSTWTMLPSLATARGGAAAAVISGKIYIAGGMDAFGASLSSVEVFDPAGSSWSSAASMATRRDNAGAAAFDGKLYVFGGRTRNADGLTVNGTLTSVEMYDPATNTWVARTPMPTGRRTMAVGTLGGRAQLMGGERTSDGGTFPQNEEYDAVTNSWRGLASMPTPRHGAAAATISGTVYVAGGGPTGGSAFTDVNEAFSFGG
jgi:glucose/arabinose dehydrogenase/N-acetylneuraminic acid mutarotase